MKVNPVEKTITPYPAVYASVSCRTPAYYFPIQQPPQIPDLSKKNNKNNIIAGVISGIVIAGSVCTAVCLHNMNKVKPEKYIIDLAEGLSSHLGKKVTPKQLLSVATKEELLSVLPKLSEQNYVASAENIEKGIFSADLHSHSNYSDGLGRIENILEEVSQYANSLFAKTKNKFIYALSDHDGKKGVIKALEIISNNPEKFKNVRFVPASELSFAHRAPKSSNNFETSEVLAYCINPFDTKTKNFFGSIFNKRKAMLNDFIDDLKSTFPQITFTKDEFSRHYNMMSEANYRAANLQWKMHHYGQTKKAVTEFAKFQNKNPEELYSEIMKQTNERGKALGNLRDKGLVPQSFQDDPKILDLCKKYSTQEIDGKITAKGENTFEEIIDVFKDDKNVFLAYAHPYYFTERVHNPAEFLKTLAEKSKELIKATETYHQAYNPSVSKNALTTLNEAILGNNEKLLSVGGRDNHNLNWLR